MQKQGFLLDADEDDRSWCRKHPGTQPPTGGVCPVCLRARLLRLCPDCASERPCGCSRCAYASTSSSSSLSSLSSLDIPQSAAARGGALGAVGRVSYLIDSEPAFRRSRSAAFHLLRPRQHDDDGASFHRANAPPLHAEGGRGWSRLWPFTRWKKETAGGAENDAVASRLPRSRSVGFVQGAYPDPSGIDVARRVGAGDVRGKGWNRYFPSPMKVFRHRKISKVVEARSPLCRG